MKTEFKDLGLATPLLKALERINFTSPTEIQAKTLPVTLARKNLVGCAQTGSGKTVAYCLPLVQRLLKNPNETALVLVPTRELVKQVGEVFNSILQNISGLRTAELIGGQSIQHQIRMLKKKPFHRIIVATPGRLIDLVDRNAVYLRTTNFLVLDEADRMLDMGFAPQLKKIETNLPTKKKRQTLMFSATMPRTVDKLVRHFLCDEVRVTLGRPTGETLHIRQSVISVNQQDKRDRLLDELRQRNCSVIVFSSSKHRTDRLASFLNRYGHLVSQIHGGRSQGQRNRAIRDFRSGKSRILVATDIAARGLDVPQVGVVINFDLPRAAEDYTHRIGRSGRAGNKGESLTFVSKEDRLQWKKIIRTCRLNLSGIQLSTNVSNVQSPQSRDRSAEWADLTNRPLKNGKEKEKKQKTAKRNSKGKPNAKKKRDFDQKDRQMGPGLLVERRKRFKRRITGKKKKMIPPNLAQKNKRRERGEPVIRETFSCQAS